MSTSQVYRITATDAEGKQRFKSFSLKKYTEEEAKILGEKWRKSIKKMQHTKHATSPVSSDSDSSSDDEPRNTIITPSKFDIPFKDFELDLPDDKSGCSIMMVASTRAGKTYALNHLYNLYFKDYITCTHTNSSQSDVYKELRKSTICCPAYMPGLIKDTYKINKGTKNKYKFLHIIDDVVDKKYDKALKNLFCIWRNSRISGIICAQEISIMDSIQRSNINFVCLGRLNSDMAIEKVIKAYLRSHFPRSMGLADCIAEYKRLTSDHHFIIIDNINDKIFKSKVRI